jgi:hypothetical protein
LRQSSGAALKVNPIWRNETDQNYGEWRESRTPRKDLWYNQASQKGLETA